MRRSWIVAGISVILILALAGAAVVADELPIRLVVDDRQVAMDVDPVIIDGRVMVPARFVAEALGATVSWDPDGRRVLISSGASAKPILPAVDTTDLIGIRDLAAYGVAVTVTQDGMVLLSRSGITVTFSASDLAVQGTLTASVLGHTLRTALVYQIDGRTYLRKADALALSFLSPESTTASGPPGRETLKPGDWMQFKNFRVVLTTFSHTESCGGSAPIQPAAGHRFARAEFNVVTGQISVSPLQMPSFVQSWQLASGENYAGGDFIGPWPIDNLRPDQDRVIEICHEITQDEQVAIIVVQSPFAEDRGTTFWVTVP